MTIAPQNIMAPGSSLTLEHLYKITLGQMGYAPSSLPDSLFFTFCGDLLGSSGEHYEKGHAVTFINSVCRASHTFSDDFMESLAMAQMCDTVYSLDLATLMKVRDVFYDLLKGHFEKASLTYSPWFRPLFESGTKEEYLKIIAGHASCGAAMRAAVLGAMDIPSATVAPLLFCSHAHPEAVEGGYFVYGFAREAVKGTGFPAALQAGFKAADEGWALACDFLAGHGLKGEGQRLQPLYDKVRRTEDPYATITDIAEEGIETRFVVPAALSLVERACQLSVDKGVAHVVEGSLLIGGDPDTICSIAMGLYGLVAGFDARQVLSSTLIPEKS